MSRTALVSLLLLLGAASSGYCADPVRIQLDRALLTWTPRQGLEVRYAGAPVFVPYPSELTAHPADWSRALFRSDERVPRVTLTRRGKRQVLTAQWPQGDLQATMVLTAGPGDRYRIEWRYSQNAWDDACLQLGLSRPAESFLAGALFRGLAGGRPVEGIVPLQPPTSTTHPFAGVTEITLSSIGATAVLKASKPITLYDYADRGRGTGFFLGLEEPLPRGKELSFAMEVELKPASVESEGLVLSRLQVPSRVDDGLLQASVQVRRRSGPATHVRLTLTGTAADGQELRVVQDAPVSGKAKEVALALRAAQPGTLRCSLAVATLPGGQEVYRSPGFNVVVLPPLTVLPGRSLYTSETEGALLVRTSAGLKGRRLSFTAEGTGFRVAPTAIEPGTRVAVPFPMAALPDGVTEVTCRLLEGEQELGSARVALHKAPPKPNEVKIDYANRGLIVDGLPYLPFGFYCIFPMGDLPTVEATQGFTHIAPYQGSDADMAAVRAYLDRCADLGLRVHYDLREIAQAEPSPEKWEKLRAQVEAVRDHPALLCWYLCDEPDGQGIPPARLEEAYRFVKELDPHHPITMVFCVPPRAPDYVHGMDIMMADPYPIPNGPVTMVSDVTDGLNEAVQYGMPLWIVPQAFGGGEGWRREPSAAEERVMTYLALIHGATGIQYFVRRAPVGNPISPSLWSECRRLALEGQELAPALLSSEPRPAVRCSDASVHVAAWRHEGAITVLAANTENRPVPVTLQLDEKVSADATVLFANRLVAVKEGVLVDVIDGFGTRAYRIPVGPEPRPLAELLPGNLTENPSWEACANVGTPDGCYVGVGKDVGASLFVDPRLAVHGRHSLRVTTPAEGEGVSILPFPLSVQGGRRYRLSIWAKGLQDGLRFRFGMNALDCGVRQFTASREWAEYTLEGVAAEDVSHAMLNLSLLSKGTIWFDLMQVVPVSDAP